MRPQLVRRLTVWLPTIFFVALILLLEFIVIPKAGHTAGYIGAAIAVGVGATWLSSRVFKLFEQKETHLRRQNQELTALNEMSRVISQSLKLDDILGQALQKVLEVIETEAGEIFLLDKSKQTLTLETHRGLFPKAFRQITTFQLGEGIPGLVASSGKKLILSDLQNYPELKRTAIHQAGFSSFASIALLARGQVVGVMDVADRRKTYTEEDVRLLIAIGNQVGIAIENAQLYSRVTETLDYVYAVIKSSGDAIITTDLEGHIQAWNTGAKQMYGWRAEEAIGQYIPMVPDELKSEAAAIMNRLRGGEVVHNFETKRLHKSGKQIDVVVTVSPLRDSFGKIVGYVGISKDMSQEKALEAEIARQRQTLAIFEERERIAREMHDGLAQVLGYVNTKAQAVRRFLTVGKVEEAQEHLIQLEDAARSVYSDVREAILGLRVTLSEDVTLEHALKEYLERFEEQSNINTELVIDDRSTLGELAPSVEVQLIRIIQESLTNVRKHASAKNICIRFERDGDYAQITIQDDGKGFEPSNGKDNGDWPQFGLRIMEERATAVNGSLEVRSEPNEGTCVCVVLPLGKEFLLN